MLPSPHARPQHSEQQQLAALLEAQQLLRHAPVLAQPNFTNLLNLYTPFKAQEFGAQKSAPAQQRAQDDHLLRRKTPTGTLPAAYNAPSLDWPSRVNKHVLLPSSSAIKDGQPQLNQSQAVGGGISMLPQGDGNMFLGTSVIFNGDIQKNIPESWLTGGPVTWPSRDMQLIQTISTTPQIPIQPQLQIPSQSDYYQGTGISPSGLLLAQQLTVPINGASEVNSMGAGIGLGAMHTPEGGWYPVNGFGMYAQAEQIPTQQLHSQLYQINTTFTPSNLQQNSSYYGASPAWNQQLRRNSGQAQTPQIINAPVTSPHPMAPYHPFVADPIHHTQGYTNNIGSVPSSTPYHQQTLPARNRVLAWAHGVYADLIQSANVQKIAQAVHNTVQPSRPAVRPAPKVGAITATTYQAQLRAHSTNSNTPRPLTQVQIDPTEDNLDRRKKRRIEFQTSSSLSIGSDSGPGYSDYLVGYNGNGSVTLVDKTYRDQTYVQKVQELQSGAASFHPNVTPQYTPQANGSKGFINNSANSANIGGMSSATYNNNNLGHNINIGGVGGIVNPSAAKLAGHHALETLQQLCAESGWRWLDGMLLGGCIAYALNDLNRALAWYLRIIEVDPTHVEALSNLGATLLALNRRVEAEEHWLKAVKLKPNYFEAVEHLVGLLCGESRARDAVALIEFVERSVKGATSKLNECSMSVCSSSSECSTSRTSASPEMKFDYFEDQDGLITPIPAVTGQPEFAISDEENGRLLGLIHAKGNMLYTLGNNAGAAKAFEDAVLVGAGSEKHGIRGLIQRILDVLSAEAGVYASGERATQPVLLTPEKALRTAQLVFPPDGELPGLRNVPSGPVKKIAISTTSNSLLSLAKIFQDGMSSSTAAATGIISASVKDILALYYLSLSLHPSPSTANNVGILLASVQQVAPIPNVPQLNILPGYTPGSGVGLALLYYQYGLMLDSRHAHLYTNLGSLLKDINNLPMAIKMYEQAVLCDPTFDIALANLANAVKDQGKTNEAIKYYKRAVAVNPNFAEAVCGLANALNSVCDWKGRGGVVTPGITIDRWHVNDDGSLFDARSPGAISRGWMGRVVSIVEKQLKDGENWGKGILTPHVLDVLLQEVERAVGGTWYEERRKALRKMVGGWAGKKNEGARVVRLIERAIRRCGWRWYHEKYVKKEHKSLDSYLRPTLPAALSIPSAPTVLPFHTFTCPLSAQQVRMISQRNGIRISCTTMRAPWVSTRVYPPPPPPSPHLNVGYISSDFNNHPLAHLMQSVFGMHDPARVKAHCYATTPSDGSPHRQQIEREAPKFYDASCWPPDRLIDQIISDGIHILVNLNGFTRGAKNEIFAARPAPIQMSFMGFAGTLGADWCDYLLADDTAVPPETLRPWRRNVDIEDGGHEAEDEDKGDWVYCENIVFTKHTFFCCDHRQSAPDAKGPRLSWVEEQKRRWRMRRELFPNLPKDAVILGNFNQLYKIEPTTFRTWLRIISKLRNGYLWLLRFPELGEANLRMLAIKWAGTEVASRIIFTDVAPKQLHIARARICDIFLDTPECNAHTTAADVTWSGTPLLTLPRHKYKMCSRIAASIVRAAVPDTEQGRKAAERLVVDKGGEGEYERRAVELAGGVRWVFVDDDEEDKATLVPGGKGAELQLKSQVPGHTKVEVNPSPGLAAEPAPKYKKEQIGIPHGELVDIRKILYESRWTNTLFDTRRWVRDLETAYEEAWRRWVEGEGGDIWL